MAMSFDKALGVHPTAMLVRAERAEVLASNLANSDTPGYKARDMDFGTAFAAARKAQSGGSSSSIARTHEKHLSVQSSVGGNGLYRLPNQPDTGDGNTVDVMAEKNKFLQNSIEYRTSMTFLNSKISGLKKALGGGQQ